MQCRMALLVCTDYRLSHDRRRSRAGACKNTYDDEMDPGLKEEMGQTGMRKAYEKRVVCMRSCWSTLSRKTKKGAISYRNIDCITDGAGHVAHASCTLSVRARCLHVCGNRGPRTTCCSCIHVSVNDNDTKCPLLKLLARSMLR